MRFELRLLGTNAALPAYGRATTAQVLSIQEQHYLIDCGEGTQVRMDIFKVKRFKIRQIFISHLHGDHIFGLWGLLTSYTLNSRKDRLQIFSPAGLEELIMPALKVGGAELSFPIEFIEVDPTQFQVVYENQLLKVSTIPLQHRIPTCGYLFKEKERERKILSEKIKEYQLDIPQILAAKAGEDIQLADGTLLPNTELTVAPRAPRSYAFCSDTLYNEAIIPHISGVDLLYHESTFCEDNADRCIKTMHSTAAQAAKIAHKAGAKKLVLGHFSSRYPDISVFEEEAKAIFPNSHAGKDGDLFSVE